MSFSTRNNTSNYKEDSSFSKNGPPPYTLIPGEASKKALQTIFGMKFSVASDHEIFKKKPITCTVLELTQFFKNFLKLDGYLQGAIAMAALKDGYTCDRSFVFKGFNLKPNLLEEPDKLPEKLNDLDVLFYADNKIQVRQLAAAVQLFVENKVIPRLGNTLSADEKEKILKSYFIKNKKHSPDLYEDEKIPNVYSKEVNYLNMHIGLFDLTVTTEEFENTCRSPLDIKCSIEHWVFFVTSNQRNGQAQKLSEIMYAIETGHINITREKVESVSYPALFQYVWLMTQGHEFDDAILQEIFKKILDHPNITILFPKNLEDRLKHIREADDALIFLMTFLLSAIRMDQNVIPKNKKAMLIVIREIQRQLKLYLEKQFAKKTEIVSYPVLFAKMFADSSSDMHALYDYCLRCIKMFPKSDNPMNQPFCIVSEKACAKIQLEERKDSFLLEMPNSGPGSQRLYLVFGKQPCETKRLHKLILEDCWGDEQSKKVKQLKGLKPNVSVETALDLLGVDGINLVDIPNNVDLKMVIRKWQHVFIDIANSAQGQFDKKTFIVACQKIFRIAHIWISDLTFLNQFRETYLKLITDDFMTTGHSLDLYAMPFFTANHLACVMLVESSEILQDKQRKEAFLQRLLPEIMAIPIQWTKDQRQQLCAILVNLLNDDELLADLQSGAVLVQLIQVLNLFSELSFQKHEKTAEYLLKAILCSGQRLQEGKQEEKRESIESLIQFYKKHFPDAYQKNRSALLTLQFALLLRDQQYQKAIAFLWDNKEHLSYEPQLLQNLLQRCSEDIQARDRLIDLALYDLQKHPENFQSFKSLWNAWKGGDQERANRLHLLFKSCSQSFDIWQSRFRLLVEWITAQKHLITNLNQDQQKRGLELLLQMQDQMQSLCIEDLQKMEMLLSSFSHSDNKELLNRIYMRLLKVSMQLGDLSYAKKIADAAMNIEAGTDSIQKLGEELVNAFISSLKESKNNEEIEKWIELIQKSFPFVSLEKKKRVVEECLKNDFPLLFHHAVIWLSDSRIVTVGMIKQCFEKSLSMDKELYLPKVIQIMTCFAPQISDNDLSLFLQAIEKSQTIPGNAALYEAVLRWCLQKKTDQSLKGIQELWNRIDVKEDVKSDLVNGWLSGLLRKQIVSFEELEWALKVLDAVKAQPNDPRIRQVCEKMLALGTKECAPILRQKLMVDSTDDKVLNDLLIRANKGNDYLGIAEELFKGKINSLAKMKKAELIFKLELLIKKWELYRAREMIAEIIDFLVGIRGYVAHPENAKVTVTTLKEQSLFAIKTENLIIQWIETLCKEDALENYMELLKKVIFYTQELAEDRFVLIRHMIEILANRKPYRRPKEDLVGWATFLNNFCATTADIESGEKTCVIKSLYIIIVDLKLDGLKFCCESFDCLPVTNSVLDANHYLAYLASISPRSLKGSELVIIDSLAILLNKFKDKLEKPIQVFEILVRFPPHKEHRKSWSGKVVNLINSYMLIKNSSSEKSIDKVQGLLLSPEVIKQESGLGYLFAAHYHYHFLLLVQAYKTHKKLIMKISDSLFDSMEMALKNTQSLEAVALLLNCISMSLDKQIIENIHEDKRYRLFCHVLQQPSLEEYDYAIAPYLKSIMKKLLYQVNTKKKESFDAQLTLTAYVCKAYLRITNIKMLPSSCKEVKTMLEELKKSDGYSLFIAENQLSDAKLRQNYIQFLQECVDFLASRFIDLNHFTMAGSIQNNHSFECFQKLCAMDIQLFANSHEYFHSKDTESRFIELKQTKSCLNQDVYEKVYSGTKYFIETQQNEIAHIQNLLEASETKSKKKQKEISPQKKESAQKKESEAQKKQAQHFSDLYFKIELYHPYKMYQKNRIINVSDQTPDCYSSYVDRSVAIILQDSKKREEALSLLKKVDFKEQDSGSFSTASLKLLLQICYLSEDPSKRAFAKDLLCGDVLGVNFQNNEDLRMSVALNTLDLLLENPCCANPNAFEDALEILFKYFYQEPFEDENTFLFSFAHNIELTVYHTKWNLDIDPQKNADWLAALVCGFYPIYAKHAKTKLKTEYSDACNMQLDRLIDRIVLARDEMKLQNETPRLPKFFSNIYQQELKTLKLDSDVSMCQGFTDRLFAKCLGVSLEYDGQGMIIGVEKVPELIPMNKQSGFSEFNQEFLQNNLGALASDLDSAIGEALKDQ